MFGREPRLPIDFSFDIRTNQEKTQPFSQFIKNLKKRLEISHDLAIENAPKSQEKQKTTYVIKVRGATLQTGDRVLVRINAFDGRHKIADRWEEDVYTIIQQTNENISVFKVRKENGTGRDIVLHRNLDIENSSNITPVDSPFTNQRLKKPIPKPRQRKITPKQGTRESDNSAELNIAKSDSVIENSDTDEDDVDIYTPLRKSVEVTTSDDQPAATEIVISNSDSGELHSQSYSERESNIDTYGNGHASTSSPPTISGNYTVGGETGTSLPDDQEPDTESSRSRRSTRARSKPVWMGTSEFVMSMTSQTPDWKIELII